jgi:hypothetical protein
MTNEKTALMVAFEKAQAAKKRLQSDREKIKKWELETKDPAYSEPIEDWLRKRQ